MLAEKERLLRNSPNAFTDECDQRLRWCAELYAELIARAVNSYDPALQDKHTKAVKALKDTRELALDAIAAIRESSRALRRDALDQMELHASQGSTSEVSRYSTEAERHGAALNAAKSALHATAKVFDTALRSIKESEHG